MDNLRNSILATVLYYDSFNFPLTITEVFKYLVNPKRFSSVKDITVKVEAADVIDELDNMARAGIIGHKNGFYFMPGKDDLYKKRIEKDKLAGQK